MRLQELGAGRFNAGPPFKLNMVKADRHGDNKRLKKKGKRPKKGWKTKGGPRKAGQHPLDGKNIRKPD